MDNIAEPMGKSPRFPSSPPPSSSSSKSSLLWRCFGTTRCIVVVVVVLSLAVAYPMLMEIDDASLLLPDFLVLNKTSGSTTRFKKQDKENFEAELWQIQNHEMVFVNQSHIKAQFNSNKEKKEENSSEPNKTLEQVQKSLDVKEEDVALDKVNKDGGTNEFSKEFKSIDSLEVKAAEEPDRVDVPLYHIWNGVFENNKLTVYCGPELLFWSKGSWGSIHLCKLLDAMVEWNTQKGNGRTRRRLSKQNEGSVLVHIVTHLYRSTEIQESPWNTTSFSRHSRPNNTNQNPKQSIRRLERGDYPPVLHMNVNCQMHTVGQGNWLSAYYVVRLATARSGVDYIFHCHDGDARKNSLILPWFQGFWEAPPAFETNVLDYGNDKHGDSYWPHDGKPPSAAITCVAKYEQMRIDYMAKQIQIDLRNMAVTMIGNQHEQCTTSKMPVIQPMIPNIVGDDVAIHFRCGDVMGGANRHDFGMLGFLEYKKWIWNTTKSVGILTQSFEAKQNRGEDRGRVGACKGATMKLVDFLKEFLGQNTRVTIHNGPNETIPLAYARLVMAKQSFCSLSSFGIFPVMGTMGHGYIQQGNPGVNNFAKYLDSAMPNLHVMHGKIMTTWNIKNTLKGQNGWDAMMDWFVTH